MPKDRKRNDIRVVPIRESYDEIPQPKGKFVDLFEEMRKQNEKAAAERPQGKDAPRK